MGCAEPRAYVGLVDGGTARLSELSASRSFCSGENRVIQSELTEAGGCHASNLISLIRAAAPRAKLALAQVFFDSSGASALAVAAALDWLVGLGVHIVNLSVGSTQPSTVLRDSCSRAHDAGCILVGSAPARGPIVFPAAYANVLRVTGDARCTGSAISRIGTDRIDFGASPQRPSRGVGDPPSGGASIAAARVTSALAALIEKGAARRSVVTVLAESCSIVGPQQGLMKKERR